MSIFTKIKEKLQRNAEIYARAWREGSIAGCGYTWLLWKHHTKFLLKCARPDDKLREYAYLNRFWEQFASVVKPYELLPIYAEGTTTTDLDAPIWIYWNDESNMPQMVRACIHRIRMNSNGHKVILVTEKTVTDYLTLDEVVWRKYRKGKISRTHFCDIVRIALLYQYGGIWMDCTILMTQPLPPEVSTLDFYTVKTSDDDTENVCSGRWSTFMMACHKGNLMMRATLDVFLEYWKRYDDIVSYVWMDYIFYLLYKHIPSIKQMLDAVPFNNPDIWIQQLNIAKPFTREQFDALLADKSRFMWKFSYKDSMSAPLQDEVGNLTLKGWICKE